MYNRASDDGGGVAIDQFDPFLPHGETTDNGVQEGPLITRQWITFADNQLHSNLAGGDGGGLYATGGARLAVTRVFMTPEVRANRAGDNGGGIRVSYATHLFATDVAFRDNIANLNATAPNADPDNVRSGGGGVAARNSLVTLRRCSFVDNTAERFAGGAVDFVSCFEGGLTPVGGAAPVAGPHLAVIVDNQAAHNVVDPPYPFVFGGDARRTPAHRHRRARVEPLSSRGGDTSVSSTEIRMVSPALPAGAAEVVVRLASGPLDVRAAGMRAVPDPVLTDITPRSGVAGIRVTLSGTGFTPGAAVLAGERYGPKEAIPVVGRTGENELQVTMPPLQGGARLVTLSVVLPSGQRTPRDLAFTYLP